MILPLPRVIGISALLLLLTASPLRAQPAPKLGSLSREWIQRGTTVEILLNGENLSDLQQILFSGDPGLSATNVPSAPPATTTSSVRVESTGGGITRAEPTAPQADARRLVLKVTATADASLNPREVRVITAHGVSNPLNLNVGQWPEIARRETNTLFTQAQFVELPAILSGAVSAAAQTNFFRFKAVADQEYVFEVDASRRGSPLDSSLAVLDLQGRELVRNEDALGLDSLLFFTPPAEGEFILALRDFRYRGGGDYSYRITAGPVPYVESFFPFGAQRGKSARLVLEGHNLEGTTQLTLQIDLRAPRSQEIRVQTSRGHSNLLPFEVSDLPEAAEAEPNNSVTNAQAVTLPVVINGRIGTERDIDRFRFKSMSDQKVVCELAAARFGSKLDALLILADARGAMLQQNDDASGADARIEFDAKKDTEYLVAVRDLTDRGGDRFGYRLSLRPPSAAAAAGFTARFLSDTPRVNRDGSTRLRCEVTRTGGFDGPVRFVAEGLPAGVQVESLTLPNTPHSGLMILSASREAATGSFPFRLLATGVIGGKNVTVTAEPLSEDRPVRQAFVTVLEPVPFTLAATTLSLGLEQNEAGSVEVVAHRREGFTGDIKLVAEGFSAGREGLGKHFNGGETTLKGTELIGRIPLTARLESEAGTRTIVVRGESTWEGRPVTTYSRPVPVSVAQYPLLLSSTLPRLSLTILPSGSASAAGEAETKIRVERRAGFNGVVDLSLEGLPAGLKSELGPIPADQSEVSLKLNATDKAAIGTNFNFTVVGTVLFNERRYKTRTGQIALSISLPEAAELATNALAAPSAAVGTR